MIISQIGTLHILQLNELYHGNIYGYIVTAQASLILTSSEKGDILPVQLSSKNDLVLTFFLGRQC